VGRDTPGGSNPEAVGGLGVKNLRALNTVAREDNGHDIHRFTTFFFGDML